MSSPDGAFNPTQWSMILQAAHGTDNADLQADALEQLCLTYWKPLYVFTRRSGRSPEDAEDLVQSFISFLLERDALKTVDRSKGKFRTFLLACLRNYLNGDHQRRSALKRGDSIRFESLDNSDAEDLYQLEDPGARQPHELFDRSWALNTIAEARARTRSEYLRSKKLDRFNSLELFLPGARLPRSPDASAFAALGRQLDMHPDTVKVEIHRLRRRFGTRLREVVTETLADPADLDAELRYLISVVSVPPPSPSG